MLRELTAVEGPDGSVPAPSLCYADLEALKVIYVALQKKDSHMILPGVQLETELQAIINDPDCNRLVLEMACKVYFLLLANKYQEIDLKAFIDLKSARASNYIVRGILATKYDFLNPDLLYCIILTAVETCLCENSVYTTIALNNLRLFCNNYRNFAFDFKELWRIVALHLSSRFIGAREEAMSILEFIVKFDPKYGMAIAGMVIQEWPWTYANKFYVLRTVIEGSYSAATLLDRLNMDTDDLVEGLLMGLKYRILYTSGQLLFRSLLRKDQLPVVIQFLREIIARKDMSLLHNFYVQWSKEIHHFRGELFPELEDLIEDEELADGFRLILMNMFREQLITSTTCDDVEVILSSDPVAKQHFYEILLYIINNEMSLSNDLQRMTRFLIDMQNEDNTTLRQHLFASFTHFIANLIKKHQSVSNKGTEINRVIAIETFFEELINKIIISGFESVDPDYPEIILSLRLFNILMKTLHCNHKSIKSADVLMNGQFQKVLEERGIFRGVSDKFFKLLINQLTSPYDDVRQMAVNIVLQFFPATNQRRMAIQEVFCEKMYFSSMDDSRRVHGYFKILVPYYLDLKMDVTVLYKEYKAHLVDNYTNHFSVDPLKSINCGIQVFDKINIIQEIVLAKRLPTEELLQLMTLVLGISTRMLHFLSLSKQLRVKGVDAETEDDITPSFQVIEESLQVLINNSGREEKEWSCSLDKAVMGKEENVTRRKDLLLAVWMTLKACGDLSATITSITDTYDCPELFTLGLQINTEILHRCRHKGAIETIGLSFGRIVAHVSSSSALLPTYHQLDSCLTLLFESVTASSYSRRGAGFSFLMLNLVKNDRQPGRPLLQKSLATIFRQLSANSLLPISVHGTFLHYLSVLVNDASLTQDILPSFNEIISLCLEKIESQEWNVRNAALQLFGSLVPKVIGQRQHSDSEWEPCQCTLAELQATMPKISAFLEFCLENHRKISRTLLIAVLSFVSNVERRQIDTKIENHHDDNYCSIDGHLFRLLSHPVEKVRALSALCFARFHRHRQHTGLAIKLIHALFTTVHDPNLQHGILMTLLCVTQKAQLECASQWRGEDEQRIRETLLGEINKLNRNRERRIEIVASAENNDMNSQKSITTGGGGNGLSKGKLNTGLCDYNQLYLQRFIDQVGLN